MNKIKTSILLVLLLSTIFIAFFPIAPITQASTGTILIGVTAPPSHVVNVSAGGNISAYFGNVVFSGGQFYLVWSVDGFSSISIGDFKFSPIFSTVDLHGSRKLSNGIYIGNNWVNISTPTTVAGGHYYVKCFDGSSTSVAVSDNYVNLLPILEVTPFTKGAGGSSISLKGSAFYANSVVNLTYYDPIAVANRKLTTVTANAQGFFIYDTTAPDLKQWLPAGENTIKFDIIKFYGNDTTTGYQTEADYWEGRRGLLQVDSVYPLTGDMFGNNTTFNIQVHVNDHLIIAGNYFHPPSVAIYFDNTAIGTATTNRSGFFNRTITIPYATMGTHKITVKEVITNQTTTTTTTTLPTNTTTTTTTVTTTTTTTTATTTTQTTTTTSTTTVTTTPSTTPSTTTQTTTTTTSQTSTPTTTTTTTSTSSSTSTPSSTTTSTSSSSSSTTSTTSLPGPESGILIPVVLGGFLIAIIVITAAFLLKDRRK